MSCAEIHVRRLRRRSAALAPRPAPRPALPGVPTEVRGVCGHGRLVIGRVLAWWHWTNGWLLESQASPLARPGRARRCHARPHRGQEDTGAATQARRRLRSARPGHRARGRSSSRPGGHGWCPGSCCCRSWRVTAGRRAGRSCRPRWCRRSASRRLRPRSSARPATSAWPGSARRSRTGPASRSCPISTRQARVGHSAGPAARGDRQHDPRRREQFASRLRRSLPARWPSGVPAEQLAASSGEPGSTTSPRPSRRRPGLSSTAPKPVLEVVLITAAVIAGLAVTAAVACACGVSAAR